MIPNGRGRARDVTYERQHARGFRDAVAGIMALRGRTWAGQSRTRREIESVESVRWWLAGRPLSAAHVIGKKKLERREVSSRVDGVWGNGERGMRITRQTTRSEVGVDVHVIRRVQGGVRTGRKIDRQTGRQLINLSICAEVNSHVSGVPLFYCCWIRHAALRWLHGDF